MRKIVKRCCPTHWPEAVDLNLHVILSNSEGGGAGPMTPGTVLGLQKIVSQTQVDNAAPPAKVHHMVNNEARLDQVFGALVSPVRRSILMQLERDDRASTSALAQPLAMKLPALMKHLDVLEAAALITREKVGRVTTIRLAPQPMSAARRWLDRYERFWSTRLDRLALHAEQQERIVRKVGR